MQIRTLDIIYNKKENSFNDLRFILATSVLFYHAYEMLPSRNHDFFTSMMNGQLSLGGLAVYAFFVLSGFFMIQSLQNAKCKMQNAKCKMQNAKCKMQNAKCKMQNAKCKMQNAKCKMQNAKCKMQNAKCKMQNAKCKMQNAKCKMGRLLFSK